jgi:hypothetical protein
LFESEIGIERHLRLENAENICVGLGGITGAAREIAELLKRLFAYLSGRWEISAEICCSQPWSFDLLGLQSSRYLDFKLQAFSSMSSYSSIFFMASSRDLFF